MRRIEVGTPVLDLFQSLSVICDERCSVAILVEPYEREFGDQVIRRKIYHVVAVDDEGRAIKHVRSYKRENNAHKCANRIFEELETKERGQ